MKIALIREEKVPVDRRVALLPEQCLALKKKYPSLEFIVQPSSVRCVADEEYAKLGFKVQENVEEAEVLFGVKEVPIPSLIPDKTYFFFSHTIKKQAYNRDLLQEVLQRNIRLIDYECLSDAKQQRLVAFGRFAGIVGAYNGIKTYGEKYQLFQLKAAYECRNMEEMQAEFKRVKLPPIKIAITGTGRVGKGAKEVLEALDIPQVSPREYLKNTYPEAVFTVLSSMDYYTPKTEIKALLKNFYQFPEQFTSSFRPFYQNTELIITAHYWDPASEALFTKEEVKSPDFKTRVIADITCDVEGSVPINLRASTIEEPIYDYDPQTQKEAQAFSKLDNITLMAVDNLPSELPWDASKSFGAQLSRYAFPALLEGDPEGLLARASITQAGQLTSGYAYLRDFVEAN